MHELPLGLVHFSEYYEGPYFVIRYFISFYSIVHHVNLYYSYAQSITIKSVPYKHCKVNVL